MVNADVHENTINKNNITNRRNALTIPKSKQVIGLRNQRVEVTERRFPWRNRYIKVSKRERAYVKSHNGTKTPNQFLIEPICKTQSKFSAIRPLPNQFGVD